VRPNGADHQRGKDPPRQLLASIAAGNPTLQMPEPLAEARRYYQRLRRKKHPHVARVALARKLPVAAWALLHDGVVFDESGFAAV